MEERDCSICWSKIGRPEGKIVAFCPRWRNPGIILEGATIRRSLMTRIVLAPVVVLLSCASFANELFAQANQTVNPVPITPPTLNTTTTALTPVTNNNKGRSAPTRRLLHDGRG